MNFRSFQQVVLIGRLGQDARLVQTKSGSEMLCFSVATTETLKTDDGAFEQRTTWHDCIMFGKRIQKLAAGLPKGSLVSVQAHLSYRSLKVGDKQYQVALIIVDDLQMLAKPAADDTSKEPPQARPTPNPQARSSPRRPVNRTATPVPHQSQQPDYV